MRAECALQIRSTAQGFVFWSEAHKQMFPDPRTVDALDDGTIIRDAFSLAIYAKYFDLEQAQCPAEVNPAYADEPSYAHDEITSTSWRVSPTRWSPSISDRGPKDGIADPTSLTYLNHGSKRGWKGNVGWHDGSVLWWDCKRDDPNPFGLYVPSIPGARDNMFARDPPGPNPTDLFLAKWRMDDKGNLIAQWD